MSLEQQVSAGERVSRFLADEAVIAAFTKLEEKYIAEWKGSKTREERESLHAKVQVVEDVRTQLRAIVDNGTRAKHEVARQQAARPRR